VSSLQSQTLASISPLQKQQGDVEHQLGLLHDLRAKANDLMAQGNGTASSEAAAIDVIETARALRGQVMKQEGDDEEGLTDASGFKVSFRQTGKIKEMVKRMGELIPTSEGPSLRGCTSLKHVNKLKLPYDCRLHPKLYSSPPLLHHPQQEPPLLLLLPLHVMMASSLLGVMMDVYVFGVSPHWIFSVHL